MPTNQVAHQPAVFHLLNSRGQYEPHAYLRKTNPPPQSVHCNEWEHKNSFHLIHNQTGDIKLDDKCRCI